MSPAKTEQNIKIQFTRNFRDIDFSEARFKKLIKAVCSEFGYDKIHKNIGAANRFEISIAIVDDLNFQEINRRFLKRKSISDCLSFDLTDCNLPGSPKIFELVINGQMALRQSKLRSHSAEAELALYITHGLLHQFGYDDMQPVKAKSMHRKEDDILIQLGFGIVYKTQIQS